MAEVDQRSNHSEIIFDDLLLARTRVIENTNRYRSGDTDAEVRDIIKYSTTVTPPATH